MGGRKGERGSNGNRRRPRLRECGGGGGEIGEEKKFTQKKKIQFWTLKI